MTRKQTKFIRGNERIERLTARPDLAEGIGRTRRAMAEADERYATGLAAFRKAAELTQAELATKLGVTQAAVSQAEQRHDMLLSTLNNYVEAMGAQATVVVQFKNGEAVEVDLAQFATAHSETR
jgi:DNA-binding XRE family transcriptional regulator